MVLARSQKHVVLGRCANCGTSVYDGWPHKCLPFKMPKLNKPKSNGSGFLIVNGRTVR